MSPPGPAAARSHLHVFSPLTLFADFKIVERLDSVPVVHDSIAYAEHLINSTQLTANLYQTAVNIATRKFNSENSNQRNKKRLRQRIRQRTCANTCIGSVEVASPVIQRAKPLIESADGLAVATFDKVEATFPCE